MGVDYTAIGQRIKGRRRAKHRTQEWLAEQLQVTVGYISQIERGVSRPNLDTLAELASYLDCELSELITGVTPGREEYLNREWQETLARMSAKQRNMLLEMADLILNY